MKLGELAARMGAAVLVPAGRLDAEISHVCAGDHVSRLLDESTPVTLVVSRLAATSVIQSAALLDAPAVCVSGGAAPSREAARLAESLDVAVLVSPLSLEETRDCACVALGLMPGDGR